jgi:hypothetical protein
LGQIINAELFFQTCYLADDILKAVMAKEFLFRVFEFFPQVLILLPGQEGREGGKENGIFARRVWAKTLVWRSPLRTASRVSIGKEGQN